MNVFYFFTLLTNILANGEWYEDSEVFYILKIEDITSHNF